jgi:PadR family transcriptional regulator PadR
MRRKQGTLIESEIALLLAAVELKQRGTDRFHGYLIAREIEEAAGARQLLAYGTLYKTLARLEDAGLLESEWEVPEQTERETRPRKRLYTVTTAGEGALASALAAQKRPVTPLVTRGLLA